MSTLDNDRAQPQNLAVGADPANPATVPVPGRAARSRRRGGWYRLALKTGLWAGFLAALVGLWQAIVTIGNYPSYLLPGPVAVWDAGKQFPALIAQSTWITVYESLLGFVLAVAFGILLAVIVTLVPALKQIVVPSVIGLNALPKVALAPIIVVLLGLGIGSKVAMAFLLAFFPVLINEIGGLDDVDPSLLEYFRLLRASRIQVLLRARLPSSLPALCDGMKIALSLAVVGAIVGEFVAADEGLGYQITVAYSSLKTPLVFALVIVVSVAAALLYVILVLLEKILFWRFPSRRATN
jgi:NitT/TauT family transport system permease protein